MNTACVRTNLIGYGDGVHKVNHGNTNEADTLFNPKQQRLQERESPRG